MIHIQKETGREEKDREFRGDSAERRLLVGNERGKLMSVFDKYKKAFIHSFIRMQSYHIRSGSYIFDKKEDATDAYEVISKMRACIDGDENTFIPITRMGGTLSDVVYFMSEIISSAKEEVIIFDDDIRNSLQRRAYFASPSIISSVLSALKNNVSIQIHLKNTPDGGFDRNLLLLSLMESGHDFYTGIINVRNIERCKCMFILGSEPNLTY